MKKTYMILNCNLMRKNIVEKDEIKSLSILLKIFISSKTNIESTLGFLIVSQKKLKFQRVVRNLTYFSVFIW